MNKEKLKGYLDKVKTALGKISKKMWIVIAAVAAVVIIGIVGIAVFLNNRPYAPLVVGANSEETATVLDWLQEQGITDYRMEGSGTITVPEGQAPALKARLLQAQYSGTNAPYSGYFERIGPLSTQTERNNAWLVTLIEEYQSTIRQFPGVRDASVTINLGEDRGYVLDSNNKVEASAGVMLTMQDGKLLSNEQANAIRNYISRGVAGLDVENVTVEDTLGNTYNSFGGDESGNGSAAESSALKLQLEQEWSNRIRTQIMQVLAPAFGGPENVNVAVNAVVELGNKEIVDYDVHLPEFAENGSTNGAGIIGTRFYAYEFLTDDQSTAGGIVGTTTNADLPSQVEQGEAVDEVQRIRQGEGSVQYDNPKTQTTMVIHCGTLTDVSVGITVNSRVVEDGVVDVAGIRQLAAGASGIMPVATEEMTAEEYMTWKIAVLATPFPVEPEPEPEPPVPGFFGVPYWVLIAAGAGLLVFAIVLTIVLLVRRKKRKKQEEEQRAVEELLATAMPGQMEIGPDGQPVEVQVDENGNPVSGANVMDLHTERSMELRQSIRDFVDENMEVAALLIKSWLKEDGDNG